MLLTVPKKSAFCLVVPHYSFIIIFPEAEHYSPNPKLSNHIHAFTVLWTMLKICVQILLLPMLYLQNSLKCLKPKVICRPYPSPPLPKKALPQENQKPTNQEQFKSSQLECFRFSFPCSFVQLLNWILQLTFARVKVQCVVLHITPGVSPTT